MKYLLTLNYYLNIRPFSKYFLENVSKKYEIFVFTAANDAYAQMICNILDPMSKYIDGIINRSHCAKLNNDIIVKQLTIFKNRNIKDMILLDNLITNFGSCIDNGVNFNFNQFLDTNNQFL